MSLAREASLEQQLISLVKGSRSIMRALVAARSLGLGSWCIGAGAVRNLVWDHLHGFEVETPPADVDLVFFDANHLGKDFERFLEIQLSRVEPAFCWECVNQATVHTWLKPSGGKVEVPFLSLEEGIASWPEIATCVGLTLTASEKIEVHAPHGLADLFDQVIRWNPERVSPEVYLERVASKRFTQRWPKVRVLPLPEGREEASHGATWGAAQASGKSLNQWATDVLQTAARA